jgi:hypothetical protein
MSGMRFKISMRWIDYLDKAIQAAFIGGQVVGILGGLVFLLFYLVLSPIFMWLPLKDVEHPTWLDYVVEAYDKQKAERGNR